MKNLKKLSGILLAIAVLLACTVSAFAADAPAGVYNNNGKITITNPIKGEKYDIYQILKLESYDQDKEAYSYIVADGWDGFVTGNGSAYLEKDTGYGYVTWKGDKTEERLVAFAKAAREYVATVNGDDNPSNDIEATKTANGPESGALEFTGLYLGYYLIDSSVGTLCSLDTTDNEAEVIEKNTVPTITKQIVSGDSRVDNNTATIGDTIKYEVVINAFKGASNYVLHDTMDSGLTFGNDVEIKIGAETLVPTTDYTVNASPTDGHTFDITFTQTCLDKITGTSGSPTEIVVTYTAELNKGAITASEDDNQNNNKAKLTYGDKNTPTVERDVYTTTYKFNVVKTDATETDHVIISGAKFKLYDAAENGNEIKVVKASDGVYRLPDSTDRTYADSIEAGNAVIKGLKPGTYYLQEVTAPDGYNKLTSRVEVTISNADLNNNQNVGDTYTSGGIEVMNKKGSLLPSTGGIGTTIFYIVGGVLVAAAVVLLVAKKRTSENR